MKLSKFLRSLVFTFFGSLLFGLVVSRTPQHGWAAPGQAVAPTCAGALFRVAPVFRGVSVLHVADFNGDGRMDVLSSGSSGQVGVWLNDGRGGLRAAREIYLRGADKLVVGDFNADGRLDLANFDDTFRRLEVWLGEGTGDFRTSAVRTAINDVMALVAGEFTGDGRLDLAAASYAGQQLWLLPGQGDGSFGTPQVLSASRFPQFLVTADFNADGRLDLVALEDETRSFVLLLSKSGGGFQPALKVFIAVAGAAGLKREQMLTADFNNDGKLDLGLAVNGTLKFWFNQGNGVLSAAGELNPLFGAPVAGDFNGDGQTDLAVLENGVTFWRGSGAGNFEPQRKYALPYLVGTGLPVDFDQDGRLDLLANTGEGMLWLRNADGSGPSGAPRAYPLGWPEATALTPRALLAGDVNNDGRLDLVAATVRGSCCVPPSTESGTVRVLLNAGAGEFTRSSFVVPGRADIEKAVLADFNGDGKLDFAALRAGSAGLAVLQGSGTGDFVNAALYELPGATALAAGDFNGDGKTDLAVAVPAQNRVYVLFSQGANFANPQPFETSVNPGALAAGDFNSDGRADLAVATDGVYPLTLWLGQTGGGFNVRPMAGAESAGLRHTLALAADFNGDGKLDLALSNGSALGVWLGDSAGNFSAPRWSFPPGGVTTLTPGDFNGDGWLDLLVKATPNLVLGDGQGQFSGVRSFNVTTFPNAAAVADFNGDGKPDVALSSLDIVLLLNDATCQPTNTPPKFTYPLLAQTVTRGRSFVLSLGAVEDAETPAAQLALHLLAAPPGFNVTHIANESGSLKVTVNVSCALAAGSYASRWRLTDGAGAGVTVEVPLLVTDPELPTPSFFAPTSPLIVPLNGNAAFGIGLTANHLAARVTVTAGPVFAASFRGKLHLSPDGSLLINDAAPLGEYTFSLSVAGECGVSRSQSFVLRVTPPTDCAALQLPPAPFSLRRSAALAVSDFNRDGNPDVAGLGWLALGNGFGGFDQTVTLAAGQLWEALVVADFNQDGWPDLAGTAQQPGRVEIYFNDQAGGFQRAAALNVTVASGSTTLAAGDFNGDGRPDLVALSAAVNPVARFAVLLNAAPTGFDQVRYFNAGADFPLDVKTGDFNRDGQLDLAFAGNRVSLLFGQGNGAFGEPVEVGGFTTAQRLAAGDLNGDGAADLAVVSKLTNSVAVLLNRGDGSFGTATTYFSGGLLASAVTIADANRDGQADLLVTNAESTSVGILPGAGAGSFGRAQGYLLNAAAGGCALADLNRDGWPELLFPGDPVGVVFGLAGGGFAAPAVYSAGNRADLLIAADFNGDGLQDVVAGGTGTASFVFVYLALPSGGFGERIVVPSGPFNFTPQHLFAADLNGDQRADLVVVSRQGSESQVAFLRNLGNGTFAQPELLPTEQGPNFVSAADFNGDGKLDLAITNEASRSVSIELNNGFGGFSQTKVVTLPVPPLSVAGADLNADGKADLIVGGTLGTLALAAGDGAGGFGDVQLLQVGPAFPPPAAGPRVVRSLVMADFNGDGKPDLAIGDSASGVLSVLFGNGAGGFAAPARLSGLYTTGVVAADFNSDGKLDLLCGSTLALNDGAGNFRLEMLTAALGALQYAVLDVNRDGKLDVVVPHFTAGVIVHFNRSQCGNGSAPTLATAVSAADFRAEALAPEQIVALFGTQLARATRSATSLPLPLNLEGSAVRVRDSANVEHAVPLFFVSPTQLNFLLPASVALGPATITVTIDNAVVAVAQTQLRRSAPGLFTADASGRGWPAAQVLRVRPDGSQQYEAVARFDAAQNRLIAVPIAPPAANEQVFLILFGTGWRGRSALNAVAATAAELALPVRFAGPQGALAGVDQLNLELSAALAGRGLVEVRVSADGQAANVVQVQFR